MADKLVPLTYRGPNRDGVTVEGFHFRYGDELEVPADVADRLLAPEGGQSANFVSLPATKKTAKKTTAKPKGDT